WGLDTALPRYTRFSLLGQEGDDVLVGNAYSEHYKYDYPFLYAQKHGTDLQDAYVALVETYAGKPFITAKRALAVTPAATGATKAVGVEVTMDGGRRDTLYAAGTQQASTLENGVHASGEFAYYSEDKDGPRQMHLAGGTELSYKGIGVRTTTAAYTGKINA